jgi:hypothetical protein
MAVRRDVSELVVTMGKSDEGATMRTAVAAVIWSARRPAAGDRWASNESAAQILPAPLVTA